MKGLKSFVTLCIIALLSLMVSCEPFEPQDLEIGDITIPMVKFKEGRDYPTSFTKDGGVEKIDNFYYADFSDFFMGKYEVDFGTWTKVKEWAEDNGYEFLADGYGGSEAEAKNTNHPVVGISVLDSMIWCNALTAYSNANSSKSKQLEYCYSINDEELKSIEQFLELIDVDKNFDFVLNFDLASVNYGAKGYRLPTFFEWLYASQPDIDNLSPVVPGYDGKDEVGFAKYAWYGANSDGKTNPVGKKLPNEAGLYDLGGNVREFVCPFSSAPSFYENILGVYVLKTSTAGGYYNNKFDPLIFKSTSYNDNYDDVYSMYYEGYRIRMSMTDKQTGFRLARSVK